MKNNIKVERAKKDLTQEQLAETLRVTRQTINAIEKNKYLPSTLLALKMSALFGVTVNELFILEEGDS
jgi:putative transcriptional regulator